MNVNFEAIEKAWFKPKEDEKYVLEELEKWLNKIGLVGVICKIQELKKEMK